MINIKKINQSDIDIVTSFLSIEKNLNNLFDIGWTEKNFINQLKKNNNLSLGLFEKSKLQGILIGDLIPQNNSMDYELHLIYVASDKRRMNFASRLLGYLEMHIKKFNIEKIFLEVSENNKQAINFYEKNNFVFFKIRHNYYRYDNMNINAKCYMKKYN